MTKQPEKQLRKSFILVTYSFLIKTYCLVAPLKNLFTFFGKLCQFFEISIILHLTESLMIFAFSSVNVDLLTCCSCSKLSFIQQRSNGKGLGTLNFLHNKYYIFFFTIAKRHTKYKTQNILTKDFTLKPPLRISQR